MDIYKAISTRKSVRSFEDREVPEEVLSRIFEAVRIAPSASNRQEWRFVVVRDPETRKKMVEAANGQRFVGDDGDKIVRRTGQPHAQRLAVNFDFSRIALLEALDDYQIKAVAHKRLQFIRQQVVVNVLYHCNLVGCAHKRRIAARLHIAPRVLTLHIYVKIVWVMLDDC